MATLLLKAVVLFCVLAACSCTLNPTHVYLSLTGDPSTVQVTFTTTTSPTHAQVHYWVTGKPVAIVAVTAADIHNFERPITHVHNFINSVTLTGLARYTYYNYQILGDVAENTTHSAVFKFRTLPADNAVVNVGLYGDLGAAGAILTHAGSASLPKVVDSGMFDFLIHNGDLGYNLGELDGGIADRFMTNLQRVSANIPYMTTPGNHEFMGTSYEYYKNYFVGQIPVGKKSGSTNPTDWYSFDAGPNLHIVGISTEVYCENLGNMKAQWEWLEHDLATVASRTTKPFIMVLGHRPLYYDRRNSFSQALMRWGIQCSGTTCNDKEACRSHKNCAYSIEALLQKYKVDIFNAGHMHLYMRHFPIASDSSYEAQAHDLYLNPQHPVYIVSGAAGVSNGTGLAEEEEEDPVGGGAAPPPTVLTSLAKSYSLVRVFNHTHLHYVQIEADNGHHIDDFWIVKDPHRGPWTKMGKFGLIQLRSKKCDQ